MRSLERGERGFEDYDEDAAGEVDAAAEMERAKVQVKELEERKALTKGDQDELDKPRMNIQACCYERFLCRLVADRSNFRALNWAGERAQDTS